MYTWIFSCLNLSIYGIMLFKFTCYSYIFAFRLNLSIYLSIHTATPSFLSITRRAALRWRKARTYLGIPGYACETTGSARRQPDHIHMGRLTHLQTENISMLARREPVPHWYATQRQKTDALPLSHGGSLSKSVMCI